MAAKSKRNKSLLMGIVLIIVFVGPLYFAHYLYRNRENFKFTQTNYGHLISPIVDVSQMKLQTTKGHTLPINSFSGKWLMVLYMPHLCQQACQKMLYNMRQVNIALGKNKPRVQRLALFTESKDTTNKLTKAYPGARFALVNAKQSQVFLHAIAKQKAVADKAHIFIIDPRGNLMMNYSQNDAPRGMLKDLKRLLKVSKIG